MPELTYPAAIVGATAGVASARAQSSNGVRLCLS
jgi:hypothetical protein